MSKIKMRCTSCGKWFQSANAKDTTCPDCTQKARREKMAAKTPPQAGRPDVGTPRPAPPPKPKPAGTSPSHWLDSLQDVKVGEPDQPPPRPKLPSSSAPRDIRGEPDRGGFRDRDRDRGPGGPGNYRERDGNTRGPGGYRERDGNTRGPGGYREREGGYRGPGGYREREGGYRDNEYRGPGSYREGGYRVGGGMGLPNTIGQRPRQPMEGGPNRSPRPDKFHSGGKPKTKKPPKPSAPPRPKKEKTPPPPPFVPTPEQVAQVENRYIELAAPTEFDGIRTQIAKELSIPKKAVKKIVKDLRDRQDIPSWWELQTYKGDEEELAKIKEAYEPLLPLPPVGVHKQIAEQLSLKPGVIYQAIKVIRQEMKLPQYNDPTLHGLQPSSAKKAKASENGATPTEGQTEPEGEATAEAGTAQVENNAELQSESHGEITSIETDTEFHREGDTIEAGTASTDNTANETPATPAAESAEQHPAEEAS